MNKNGNLTTGRGLRIGCVFSLTRETKNEKRSTSSFKLRDIYVVQYFDMIYKHCLHSTISVSPWCQPVS